jgi:malto-oligosyltrehalose trehalohydrolase
MIRRHDMPFGATVLPEGGVRFGLWAPACRSVAVEITDGKTARRLAMSADREGLFQVEDPEARAGERYVYLLDGEQRVPDPASRFQPDDVHGASEIIDPAAYPWRDANWKGRRWEEAVLYELHVGAFSPDGNFDGVKKHLDHLVNLGVTAIELMPLSDWPGGRNWGYDGVFPFAPDATLGGPRQLKSLIETAHGRGLMVFLDVVYNHFGPEGNYLGLYAPPFFTDRHMTPWGAAIDFEGTKSRMVREFFIHNALYWLEEFGLDGLRFDAVHAIIDASNPDFLTELAAHIHARFDAERPVHLVLENDKNEARYLARNEERRVLHYAAQWNDDFHHAAHVLLTGETEGYYSDYRDQPASALGRALAEGFVYQGEPSAHRHCEPRGEISSHLPPTAFVNFIQNHDQIGNRAFGDRIDELAEAEAVEAGLAVLLLAPSPPLLFMGQEWGTLRPFPFFTDWKGEMADLVREGRRREFASFAEFRDEQARAKIPDPNAVGTFTAARLDWNEPSRIRENVRLALCAELLKLRRNEVLPLILRLKGGNGRFAPFGKGGVIVEWRIDGDMALRVTANLSPDSEPDPLARQRGRIIYSTRRLNVRPNGGNIPPWWVIWEVSGQAPRSYYV